MSCVQLSEGVSRWFTPSACSPGHLELSKSYMDMASKLFTFTFTFTTVPKLRNLQTLAPAPRSLIGRNPIGFQRKRSCTIRHLDYTPIHLTTEAVLQPLRLGSSARRTACM